jgi:nucleoporin p58/p45
MLIFLSSPNTPSQNQASSQQPTSIFSTSIGQYSQQHQTIPGVRISINELRPTTRFNDLHEELQKIIEDIDHFILGQMKYQADCETLMSIIDHKSSPIANDVEYCTKTLETLQIALENDAEAIAHAKTLVTTDVANAKLSFKIIQALKTPQHFHHFALWQGHHSSPAGDPSLLNRNEATPNTNLVSYFSEAADHMSQTLNKYKANITDVETYLRGLEANLGQQVQQMAFTRGRDGRAKNADDQVRELAAVLREFEAGILGVAGKVGGAREKVQELILA